MYSLNYNMKMFFSIISVLLQYQIYATKDEKISIGRLLFNLNDKRVFLQNTHLFRKSSKFTYDLKVEKKNVGWGGEFFLINNVFSWTNKGLRAGSKL